MKTRGLKKFFENKNFNVHLTKQDGMQCAEIESWTNGGVNMILWLYPFTIESFKNVVECFDVDEEIDLHRQSESYRNAFKIKESVKDFNDFHERIKYCSNELTKMQ